MTRLEAIAAREQAAPKGPWRTYPNPMRADGVFVAQVAKPTAYPGVTDISGLPVLMAVPEQAWGIHSQIEPAAGAFIAAARQDIPWLLARVQQLEAALRAMHNIVRDEYGEDAGVFAAFVALQEPDV